MSNATTCPCPVSNSDLVDITMPAVVIFPVVLVLFIAVVKRNS